jgi:hypothetical protein
MSKRGSSRLLPSGFYNWLIPLVLGVLALALLAIVVAILAAALGLWPIA